MTDLRRQATDYAEYIMSVVAYALDKAAITDLLADAYEQGWVDRDTRDMKPETQHEFFNGEEKMKDCKWYSNGYCAKALPGIECDITKCVCYTPKKKRYDSR